MSLTDEEQERALAEVRGAEFGDSRLSRRLLGMVAKMAAAPGASLPDGLETDAQLEGAYRFLSNDRVTPHRILKPHFRQTAMRAAQEERVLVLHDSTEVWYRGDEDARIGLGYLSQGHRGYLAHVAFAVSSKAGHAPLGAIGLQAWVPAKPDGIPRTPAERTHFYQQTPAEQRKTARWRHVAEEASLHLSHPDVVHVMDREADNYLTLEYFLARNEHFVIRSNYDRHIVGDERLHSVLSDTPTEFLREVPLSKHKGRRRGRAGKRGPARTARTAKLHVRGGTVSIIAASTTGKKGATLKLNLVQVLEPSPPPDEEPICWNLLTSEPIGTHQELENVVDIYSARWVIEEYFKALKTGCALERRQLASLESLLNVLALLMPIAWRMLALRNAARVSPDAAASTLEPDELKALRVFSKRVVLNDNPTNRDVLLALAGMGGHLKRNGEPGWQTLAKGCMKFATLYEGWALRGKM